MKVVIDRIEGDYAVVETENSKMVNLPRELVPAGAKERDVIDISIDESETEKRHKRINDLARQLWNE